MIKHLIALSVLLAATPAQAAPVCYMRTASGVLVDLSYMCGVGTPSGQPAVLSQSPIPFSLPTPSVWTRNYHFSNIQIVDGRRLATSRIVGNVHNSGSTMVQNVEIEATGYAEGRSSQTRRVVIPVIGADNVESAAIDFGFSVPVDTWDVRIVGWE